MSSQPSGPRKAAFAFIFITVVLDMLALGMIVPVLPKLVEDLVGGDTAHAAEIYGLFGAVWALMQFIFSPVLGSLSDRRGRRPVILLSNLGLGLDYVVMALAPSVGWLFLGRVISGITSATFATANAYIADVTPPEDRAGSYGMLSAAFGLGFVAGPALGGLLGGVDPRLPFWVAAAMSLANFAYGFFVLPESLPAERRTAAFEWHRASPVGSVRLLRTKAELVGLAIVHFICSLAHEALPTIFVLYATYRYGWGARAVGLSIAAVGVCSAIVGAGMVRRLVGRYGDRPVLLAGLLFYAVGFVLYGFAPTGTIFLLAIPVGGLSGLYPPPLRSLMTRWVGDSEQGQLQGALSSLSGIAFMIGPLVFTQVFAGFIEHGAFSGWKLPGAPFLLAATLAAVSTSIAWRTTAGEGPTAIAASGPTVPESVAAEM